MNKPQKASFFKGKGFYIALSLIIIGAAIASYVAVNSMLTGLSKQNEKGKDNAQWGFEDTQVEKKQENIKKPQESQSKSQNTDASSSVQPNSQKAQAGSSEPPKLQTPSYVLPMSGAVTANFSADELVYNNTMGDWRTHNGIDIAAVAGTEVKAPMNAKISKAYEDDMWGNVVELTDGTVTVRVMGLAAKLHVQEGNEVLQGTVLGTLGEIAAESANEAHLHVETEQNGALIDPASLLK